MLFHDGLPSQRVSIHYTVPKCSKLTQSYNGRFLFENANSYMQVVNIADARLY